MTMTNKWLIDRTCVDCGLGFTGGRSAKRCLDCRRLLNAINCRAWHQANRQESNAKRVARAQANRNAEHARKTQWQKTNPEQRLLLAAKSRAKKSNIPFNLTSEDVRIPTHCPYLGILLVPGEGKVHRASPTLDRIIPELGYVKGNVQVISHMANAMKQNATPEELVKFARAILEDEVEEAS